MVEFGHLLPIIRKQIDNDLKDVHISKNKIIATVRKLLDTTLIRVGHNIYAKENKSYGLTTLREKHVEIDGNTMYFEFQGKSHKHHYISIHNRRLAKIVRECIELPGYEIFQYLDEHGQRHKIQSSDINEYLHTLTSTHISAKDFRTWWATVFSLLILSQSESDSTIKKRKQQVTLAVREVAKKLGNTPTICRKHYIYPNVLNYFIDGHLGDIIQTIKAQTNEDNLSPEEVCALRFLERESQLD
jgi:DNA topoisomerase I